MGIKARFFDWLGHEITDAKLDVTSLPEAAAQAYFRELALYIAISYIANTLSKCECKVYKKGEEVQDALYYALNVSPNPNMCSSQFWNKLVNKYYREGQALVIGRKDNLYIADGFTMEEKPLGSNVFTNISVENELVPGSFNADDVFFFRLDDKPVFQLIRGAANAYTELLAAAMKAYKRDKGRKYKLSLANTKAGDADFNAQYERVVKKQLEDFMNHDNAVYPEYNGYNLSDLSPNNSFHANATGEDIFGLRKEIFEITAQALKIPVAMMYGNLTSISDVMDIYLTICIDPLADMFSEELTRKTNTRVTWAKGNYIRIDTSRVRHIDLFEIAPNIEKLVSCGVVRLDEVREQIGYPKYDDEFGRMRFVTKNFERAEDVTRGNSGGDNTGNATANADAGNTTGKTSGNATSGATGKGGEEGAEIL